MEEEEKELLLNEDEVNISVHGSNWQVGSVSAAVTDKSAAPTIVVLRGTSPASTVLRGLMGDKLRAFLRKPP